MHLVLPSDSSFGQALHLFSFSLHPVKAQQRKALIYFQCLKRFVFAICFYKTSAQHGFFLSGPACALTTVCSICLHYNILYKICHYTGGIILPTKFINLSSACILQACLQYCTNRYMKVYFHTYSCKIIPTLLCMIRATSSALLSPAK